MIIPDWLPVFGDTKFRGVCPSESAEQVTFWSKLRREYPASYGLLAIHPRNEGKRSVHQTSVQLAEGMSPGAADIIIPGGRSLVLELKRRDHTKSKWQPNQLAYLEAAHKSGAMTGVALGWEAAWQAFLAWHEAR
jgi:hypothetical protein